MARVDPLVLGILSDLAKGLRALGVEFCVIGALVPEMLLSAAPRRLTHDADTTVVVDTPEQFDRLKEDLAAFGFVPSSLPYRLKHRSGGWVDLLPYSPSLVPTGRLEMPGGLTFTMAGFDQIMPNRVEVPIATGLTLPMVTVPLYVLLKLVAYGDRKEPKDLAGVLHCLRHYAEEEERRYGLEHEGTYVPFEYTCAYLAGLDGRRLRDSAAGPVGRVLDRFDSPDAVIVGLVAREDGRLPVRDEDRIEIFELFAWFRRAADV